MGETADASDSMVCCQIGSLRVSLPSAGVSSQASHTHRGGVWRGEAHSAARPTARNERRSNKDSLIKVALIRVKRSALLGESRMAALFRRRAASRLRSTGDRTRASEGRRTSRKTGAHGNNTNSANPW